jgi:cytochrome P450
LCEQRRHHPGDDLLTDLVRALDAGHLTREELYAYVLMMFMNGLDTLTSGLTMAVWEFLQHDDVIDWVARDITNAEATFDEAMRLHTPVRFGARFLNEDLALGGYSLHRNEAAVLFYASSNRDPSRFIDPEHFDARRPRSRHLAFGHGAHHCLGQQLSVMTGAALLQSLASLRPRLSVSVSDSALSWGTDLLYRTLTSLPVRVARTHTERADGQRSRAAPESPEAGSVVEEGTR